MTRQEWREQIATIIADRFEGQAPDLIVGTKAVRSADAVLALIEQQGRVLWWCPWDASNPTALTISWRDHCQEGPHRRGVFIELEKT